MPAKKEQQQVLITLPNSVEAEMSVLCCILRDETYQMDIIAQLKEDDFYQHTHKIIFRAMQEISSATHKSGVENKVDSVNMTSLIDTLRRNGQLSQVGDIDYIVRLNEYLPSTANYDEHLSIVIRASKMRQLIAICAEVDKKARSLASAEEAITFAEEKIFQLSQNDANGGLVSLAKSTSDTLAKINDRYKNPGKFRGIETGFRRFDRMTNGLHGGEFIVLAARPGVGKSALAMNIVEHVAKQGKTVAVFSLEMSNEQLIERLLASMSTVPLEYIKSGQLPNGANDIAKLRIAQETICSKMNLYGNDYASIKVSEIASQCRRLKMQHGLDLIVIDYIQLMSGADKDSRRPDNREQEVARISRALKLLAKDLNVPVIALSQLKRDAEIRNIKGKEGGGGGEPVLSDIRESGSIEQDADIVLFIHKSTDQTTGNTSHSLIIAKHRNGEQGNIPLYWIGKIVRFVDEDYLMQHNVKIDTPSSENDGNEQPSLEEMGTPVYDGEGEEETFTISEDVKKKS